MFVERAGFGAEEGGSVARHEKGRGGHTDVFEGEGGEIGRGRDKNPSNPGRGGK